MKDMTMMMNEYNLIGINQCLCLPKAEMNTKSSTRWQLLPTSWVFGVQCRLKSVSATAEKRVEQKNYFEMFFFFHTIVSSCPIKESATDDNGVQFIILNNYLSINENWSFNLILALARKSPRGKVFPTKGSTLVLPWGGIDFLPFYYVLRKGKIKF